MSVPSFASGTCRAMRKNKTEADENDDAMMEGTGWNGKMVRYTSALFRGFALGVRSDARLHSTVFFCDEIRLLRRNCDNR